MLIQGGGGIGDILGGLLSAGAQYVHGAEQAKQQNIANARQKAIDDQNAQLTALSIANQRGQLRSQGIDEQGNPLPDPYTPAPTQTQSFLPSPSLNPAGQPVGPPTPGPMVSQPGVPNVADHIAALLAAGQSGPAANLRAGQQAQNAQTTFDNQQTTFNQGQSDRDTAAAQAAALAQFRSGLQYPKNWNTMPADQQIAYLQQRQNAAQKNQDAATFTQTGQQIKDIQGPQNLADKLQNQRDMLTQRLQSADALQSARLIAALGRVGQGHPLTDYEIQSLQLQKDRFNAEFPGGVKPVTTKQDPALTGQVESLRKQYDNFLYNNRINDTSVPQAQAKIKAWVASQQFPPGAISQVIPFAASAPSTPPIVPPPPNPPAGGKTIVGSDGHTYQQVGNGWKVVK